MAIGPIELILVGGIVLVGAILAIVVLSKDR